MINTKMTNASGDPVVTRVNHPEHFATEDSNVHLYVPKSHAKEVQHLVDRFKNGEDGLTSMQPRTNLPWVNDNAVRNHAVVVTTESAATVERTRSLAQLARMSEAGNEDATTTLKALEGFVIDNDTTVQPFDPTIQREWCGVWRRK